MTTQEFTPIDIRIVQGDPVLWFSLNGSRVYELIARRDSPFASTMKPEELYALQGLLSLVQKQVAKEIKEMENG